MARQDQQTGSAKGQPKSGTSSSSGSKDGKTDQGKHGAASRPDSPIAVQRALKGIHYPASKDELLRQAQQNNASQEVLGRIRAMRGDRFEKPTDVMKALGKTA